MQTSSHLVWTKGRGRGFRPAGTFNPARRPGESKPREGTEPSVQTQKSTENNETGASNKTPSQKGTGTVYLFAENAKGVRGQREAEICYSLQGVISYEVS